MLKNIEIFLNISRNIKFLVTEEQKQLFIENIDIPKENKLFFRGANTTDFVHNLRMVIMKNLENEKDIEFKNNMIYEFLTKTNYESIQIYKKYKFLLNLPGRYPWSTRLKNLYMCKSYIINVRVTTKGDGYEDMYISFVDFIVPDLLCFNIDMIYYYYDENTNNVENEFEYNKKNLEETNKVYEEIKKIYYKYKNNDPYNDSNVIQAYNIINQFKINDIHEYFFKILNNNYNIGLKQFFK